MICVLSVIPITFVIFNILYKSSHLLNVFYKVRDFRCLVY